MIFLVSPPATSTTRRSSPSWSPARQAPFAAAIAELRARHDIEQLTPQVIPGRL
jgi:hypothetical protein